MVEASFTGLIRTVVIVIGAIVILRFIGQLMNAKRNLAEQDELNERERKLKAERERTNRNLGKTTIIDKGNRTSNDVEDVDFEELSD